MRNYFEKLLLSYDYASAKAFFMSLAPSFKYEMLPVASMVFSAVSVVADKIFGLDVFAFGAFFFLMVFELLSGIWAANVKQEPLSSMKLSRFTFKVAIYLVIIAVPYNFAQSFKAKDYTLATTIFDWMYVFLVIQIVQEHLVSILENVAVISGRPKTHWISKLQEKIGGLLK
jgi:phage-related holin